VVAPDGLRLGAQFLRAGFLTLGDRPELYFFRLAPVGPENPAHGMDEKKEEDVTVGISGDALRRFETHRRSLSREEKIDLTGLLLKKNIEAGKALDSKNLLIRDQELAALAGELNLPG